LAHPSIELNMNMCCRYVN